MEEIAAPRPHRIETASLVLAIAGIAGLAVYVVAACLDSSGYSVMRSIYASLGGTLPLTQRMGIRLLGRYVGWGLFLFVASTLCAAVALLVGSLVLRRDVVPNRRVRLALATASVAVVLAAALGMLMASTAGAGAPIVNMIK